jgi:hypothetical protein
MCNTYNELYSKDEFIEKFKQLFPKVFGDRFQQISSWTYVKELNRWRGEAKMKIFEEWLGEASPYKEAVYALQFKVGNKTYYYQNPRYMKQMKVISFKNINFEKDDYLTTDINKAYTDFKSSIELEMKNINRCPNVIKHLFGDEDFTMKAIKVKNRATENEQEMLDINEDWSSDITKVFGKQFLTYTRSSQFLNDNDIDIAKSDYEVIDAPYSLKKFKKYPFVIVKTEEDSLPIIFEVRSNGDWFIHKSNGKNTSVDFDEVVAAVGIKKVVRNTELKQKRKDDYEDTRAAKERDPIYKNRMKRLFK